MKTAFLLAGAAALGPLTFWAAPAFAKPPLTRDAAKNNADFLFNLADSNRDGRITRAEFDAYLKETNSDPAKAVVFDQLDANHDGVLTKDEVEADALAKFDRVDTNHDGVLEPDELAAAKAAKAAAKAAAAAAAPPTAAPQQPIAPDIPGPAQPTPMPGGQ